MSKTQEYQKKIADKLAFLESKLKAYSGLQLRDENIAMEDVVCRLLNLMYGYSLVNLNIGKGNYPGIDLGDEHNRIAVQVTSDNSREKVRETIRKFREHGYGEQYDRLIIFVLGTRRNFSKAFETDGVPFTDEEDIWDFNTLTGMLKGFNLEKLEQIHRHLEREYPQPNRKRWIMAAVPLIVLMVLAGLCIKHLAATQPEDSTAGIKPMFVYDTSMDWLHMDEAASVLGTESQIQVYKPQNVKEYDQGAVLTALYSNYSNQDRCITKFTVYAEDIREDLSPVLWYDAITNDGVLDVSCYNNGWGETGALTVEYVEIIPYEKSSLHDCVDIMMDPDAVSSWSVPSIDPGTGESFKLLNVESLRVTYIEPFDGVIKYQILFRIYSEETGFETVMPCWLDVYPDEVNLFLSGGGDGGEKNYVVWVETSEPQWQETYTVQQWLPAKKTVRLPVFIVAEKTCTMTVRIEFETADGEIIQATPLENARFVVPYYEEPPEEYIDGKLLDWEHIDGTEVFYFPFVESNEIVKMEK